MVENPLFGSHGILYFIWHFTRQIDRHRGKRWRVCVFTSVLYSGLFPFPIGPACRWYKLHYLQFRICETGAIKSNKSPGMPSLHDPSSAQLFTGTVVSSCTGKYFHSWDEKKTPRPVRGSFATRGWNAARKHTHAHAQMHTQSRLTGSGLRLSGHEGLVFLCLPCIRRTH